MIDPPLRVTRFPLTDYGLSRAQDVAVNLLCSVLSVIRGSGFPDAVVAGGAVRDILMDRTYRTKDIDIFASHRAGSTQKVIDLADSVFLNRPSVRCLVDSSQSAYFADQSVSEVWDIAAPAVCAGLPIQLVLLNNFGEPLTPEKAIERIDLGLCQAAFDGWAFYVSQWFIQDSVTHSFTITRSNGREDLERSVRRIERLRANGYGDFEPYI